MNKYDKQLLEDFASRYATGATLMAGAVYEASWDIKKVTTWWNELFQYEMRITWVSDPRLVSEETGTHIVALGPSGHTVDAKGKRHSESTLNCAQDKMRVRELALAGEEFTSKDFRKLTASVGWNLICGPELDHADLLLGWTLEAGDPPAGFDAVAGPKGVVYGYRLAAVGSDPGWKRVDLSQAALAAVLDRIRSMPGAPKDKPKLKLIAGGERISSFAGGPVEVGSQASFEPTESDLAEIFAGLEESSADCFDPPLAFSSLERRGDMLRLVVDGNLVEIPWGNDWAEAGDIEDQLFAALSQYQSQRAY